MEWPGGGYHDLPDDAARAYQALLYYTLGHALLKAPYAALDPTQTTAELTASRLMCQALPASDLSQHRRGGVPPHTARSRSSSATG